MRWHGKEDSYFEPDVGNQIEIVGYKFEKDRILKDLYLLRDATNYVGRISGNQSLLMSMRLQPSR